MPTARVCTECGGSLAGLSPSAYTDTAACRKKRQRRRAKEKAERSEREATVSEVVARRATDVAHDVLKEELRPIVRGAITEDVLKAVNKMVALTGKAVDVLGEQLDSEDQVLAGRAAALVVKYTVGHPALVRPEEESPQAMQVIFQLPRPDQPAPQPVIEADEEDTTNRVCDICNEAKPPSAFEGDSDRCTECFRKWREQILHSVT